MLHNLKKRESGFTIVEVMIVLAIAGLIILVVLLAVPALQRNSRNTSIKNDASAVAGGISDFISNNNGKLPTALTGTGTITIGAATENQVTAKTQGSTTVTWSTTTGFPTATGTLNVIPKFKCADDTSQNPVGSPRSVAITYLTELSGSNTAKQCVDA